MESIAKQGSTPLVVADGLRVLGVIQLKDIVKGGIRERFGELRRMGIKTVMITGDNQDSGKRCVAVRAIPPMVWPYTVKKWQSRRK